MGEKTEKATPKKLRDAKKKGQVAKSQDLPSAFTFVVSIWVLVAMSPWLYDRLGGFTTAIFKMTDATDIVRKIPEMYYQGLLEIFYTSLPILGIVVAVGVLINFLAVGPVFALEVFKFDIKKFDPVQNLKAKFKMKTFVELIKQILKISIAGYLIYLVMYKSLPVLTEAVKMPMVGALLIFHTFLLEVVIKVGLFFVIVAVADFAYQKYNFGKEMMMEKFEIKQEYKNTEGDPQIKSKRKQAAQEIAYSEGPAAGVQKSKAVVTNPIHLAIAIAYDREVDAAPFITAMGDGHLAERIIFYAEKYNIPIVRNIPLAHKLFDEGDLNDYVPEDTYEALAEIVRWVSELEGDKPQINLSEKK